MTTAAAASPDALLEVSNLRVSYAYPTGRRDVVRDASFTVGRGEIVAVVGESGSGKSTTAHSIIGMLAVNGRIDSGAVKFDGRDLVHVHQRELRAIRGREVGFVPQDPMVSLNPAVRIGRQIREALRIHKCAGDHDARVLELLERVGMQDPVRCVAQFPYQLSGGMRQRVLMAIASACDPRLIIADEPTSALDVTVQKHILDNLTVMNEAMGLAILLITHDMGIAMERAHRMVVMRDGVVVEEGLTSTVCGSPGHPYTRHLLDSAPSLTSPRLGGWHASSRGQSVAAIEPTAAPTPLLEVRDLVKTFPIGSGRSRTEFRAVESADLVIAEGSTTGLVGESGSGKTTFARMVMLLESPTSGSIRLCGRELTRLGATEVRQARRDFQMIYQSPFASLDPRMTVRRIIEEPLQAYKVGDRASRTSAALGLLDRVALPASLANRRPRELSGGQRQRVAIARALALSPKLVVCDEPVSALDVSVQAQVLELLAELQRELGLSYLFISHDLAVVRQLCDEVSIMQRGRIVESGPVEKVFAEPAADYTKQLLAAIPRPRVMPVD